MCLLLNYKLSIGTYKKCCNCIQTTYKILISNNKDFNFNLTISHYQHHIVSFTHVNVNKHQYGLTRPKD